MKRKTLNLAVCAVVMTLALSVTACGGSDDAVTADSSGVEEIAEIEPEVEEEPEAEPEVEEEPEVEAEPEIEAEPKVEAEPEIEVDLDSENTEEETEEAEDAYTTLEDYFSDPANKEALESAYATMAGDGMSVDCVVKGNEFTIILKIEDHSMIVDNMGAALSAALDAQEDTFKAQVKLFDDYLEQEGACTVIMRYTDPDDNILAEKAFTAN